MSSSVPDSHNKTHATHLRPYTCLVACQIVTTIHTLHTQDLILYLSSSVPDSHNSTYATHSTPDIKLCSSVSDSHNNTLATHSKPDSCLVACQIVTTIHTLHTQDLILFLSSSVPDSHNKTHATHSTSDTCVVVCQIVTARVLVDLMIKQRFAFLLDGIEKRIGVSGLLPGGSEILSDSVAN